VADVAQLLENLATAAEALAAAARAFAADQTDGPAKRYLDAGKELNYALWAVTAAVKAARRRRLTPG